MSLSRFKTMRHMETVRNYLNTVVIELLNRGQQHDQSKLESPEVELLESATDKLRHLTFGSEEYKKSLEELKPAIEHHYKVNRHHPEYHPNGIKDMNLIDLLEMICDWQAATMRMDNGNIFKSIDIQQIKYGYSDEVKELLKKTAEYLVLSNTFHKAKES